MRQHNTKSTPPTCLPLSALVSFSATCVMQCLYHLTLNLNLYLLKQLLFSQHVNSASLEESVVTHSFLPAQITNHRIFNVNLSPSTTVNRLFCAWLLFQLLFLIEKKLPNRTRVRILSWINPDYSVPESLKCPLTCEIYDKPKIIAIPGSGYTYEFRSLSKWFHRQRHDHEQNKPQGTPAKTLSCPYSTLAITPSPQYVNGQLDFTHTPIVDDHWMKAEIQHQLNQAYPQSMLYRLFFYCVYRARPHLKHSLQHYFPDSSLLYFFCQHYPCPIPLHHLKPTIWNPRRDPLRHRIQRPFIDRFGLVYQHQPSKDLPALSTSIARHHYPYNNGPFHYPKTDENGRFLITPHRQAQIVLNETKPPAQSPCSA